MVEREVAEGLQRAAKRVSLLEMRVLIVKHRVAFLRRQIKLDPQR